MSSPEKLFNNWFLKSLPATWHSQRIETTTGRGVPDINIRAPEGEFWVEMKRRR